MFSMFLGEDDDEDEELSSEEDRIILTDRISNAPPKDENIKKKEEVKEKKTKKHLNSQRRLQGNHSRGNSRSRTERADLDSLFKPKSKANSNEDNLGIEVSDSESESTNDPVTLKTKKSSPSKKMKPPKSKTSPPPSSFNQKKSNPPPLSPSPPPPSSNTNFHQKEITSTSTKGGKEKKSPVKNDNHNNKINKEQPSIPTKDKRIKKKQIVNHPKKKEDQKNLKIKKSSSSLSSSSTTKTKSLSNRNIMKKKSNSSDLQKIKKEQTQIGNENKKIKQDQQYLKGICNQHAEQIENFENKLSKFNDDHQKPLEDISNKFTKYESRIKELEQEKHQAQRQVVGLQDNLNMIDSKYSSSEKRLRNEIASVLFKIEQFSTDHESVDELRKVNKRVQNLQEQNNLLRENENSYKQTIINLKNQVESLHNSLEKVSNLLQQEHEFRIEFEEISKNVPELAESYENAKSLAETYCKKIIAMEKELEEFRNSNHNLKICIEEQKKTFKNEMEEIVNKYKEAKNFSHSLTLKIQDKENFLSYLEANNSELIEEKQKLGNRNENLLQCLTEKEAIIKESSARELELLSRVDQEINRAARAQTNFEEIQQQWKLYQEAYDVSGDQGEQSRIKIEQDYESKIDIVTKKHNLMEEEYQKQIIDLQRQISTEKSEAAKLNRMYSAIDLESKEMKKCYETEFNSMKDEISRLKAVLHTAEFKKQSSTEQSNRLLSSLQNMDKERIRERKLIDREIERMKEDKKHDSVLLNEARDKFLEVETENKSLQKNYEELLEHMNDTEGRRSEQIKVIEQQWKSKYDKTIKNFDRMTELYFESEEKLEQLIEHQSKVREKWKLENRGLSMNFQHGVKAVKNQNENLKRQISSMNVQYQRLRKQFEQSKYASEGQNHERINLQSLLSGKCNENNQLMRKVKHFQENEKRLVEEITRLKIDMGHAELELKNVKTGKNSKKNSNYASPL